MKVDKDKKQLVEHVEKQLWCRVDKANAQATIATQQLVDKHEEGDTFEFCTLVYRFCHSTKTIVLQNPDRLDQTLLLLHKTVVKENFAPIGWKLTGLM